MTAGRSGPRFADGMTPVPRRRDVEDVDTAVKHDEPEQPLTTTETI